MERPRAEGVVDFPDRKNGTITSLCVGEKGDADANFDSTIIPMRTLSE